MVKEFLIYGTYKHKNKKKSEAQKLLVIRVSVGQSFQQQRSVHLVGPSHG